MEGILSITGPSTSEKLFTTSILQAAMLVNSESENIHELAEKINAFVKSLKKTGRASMTTERIDYLIDDSGAGMRTDYSQKWITSINPQTSSI